MHRPDHISKAEHRRLLDVALLARDRLWLKKIKAVEIRIMYPFHAPLTTLIRTTEREIEEKAGNLEPQSPSD